MGSGFQVLLPILISVYFFVNDQKISGAVCLAWAGQNLLNVSIYAGDAIKMQLDLLGGDVSMHDWNYLLRTTNLLRYTDTIARCIYTAGVLTILAGCLIMVYYTFKEVDPKN